MKSFPTIQPEPTQLKRETKYGVFLWWSDQTPCWVHPDDVELATELVPGGRIFRREECTNASDCQLGYSLFRYGPFEFRAQPALWLEVKHEGIEVNDFVEVKSGYGKLRARIATVRDIFWNRHTRRIEYHLTYNDQRLKRPHFADELQPALRLGSHFNQRELALGARR